MVKLSSKILFNIILIRVKMALALALSAYCLVFNNNMKH